MWLQLAHRVGRSSQATPAAVTSRPIGRFPAKILDKAPLTKTVSCRLLRGANVSTMNASFLPTTTTNCPWLTFRV